MHRAVSWLHANSLEPLRRCKPRTRYKDSRCRPKSPDHSAVSASVFVRPRLPSSQTGAETGFGLYRSAHSTGSIVNFPRKSLAVTHPREYVNFIMLSSRILSVVTSLATDVSAKKVLMPEPGMIPALAIYVAGLGAFYWYWRSRSKRNRPIP